ncbi:protein of unknown function [Methylotuvimicrobium alcaliphilum 20Z]|uniref:Uncharacterized protein n=1 Tax=Methylotuvimicrobium alcaliphilum (strain DSM 19304 / NCIMB 14124 / VKM B-2133 / 20Z) TaxID=1091494 RepID=G4SZ38_META2|nr:protein of unknown function [Methylotuvimicrobium alcaliphilum 20Z]
MVTRNNPKIYATADGARQISENPLALKLRRMPMIAEVSAEQNTTTILLLPYILKKWLTL